MENILLIVGRKKQKLGKKIVTDFQIRNDDGQKGNIPLNKLPVPGEVVENMHVFFTNVLKLKNLKWIHLNTCI